jgi:hypothetical protein
MHQELTHHCDKRDSIRLTACAKALIKWAQNRIQTRGMECRHIESGASEYPPAPNRSTTGVDTRIVVNWSQSDQCGDFAPTYSTKLRDFTH